MNLKNNTITVGELLADPKARAVFQRRFGKWMKHPMVTAGRSLTLAQLVELAGVYLSNSVTKSSGRPIISRVMTG